MKFSSVVKTFAVIALACLANAAYAVAPANSVIRNTATLDYDGLATPIEASVDVTIGLNQAAPILSSPADGTAAENGSVSYIYTITSAANGSDAYDLTSNITPDNLTGTSGATFTQGAATVTQLTLGATASNAPATAGSTTLSVPSDGVADGLVNNIGAGDTIVIDGVVYTVQNVVDDGVDATITLDPATPLAANVAVGTLIAEQQQFTVTIADVGSINAPGPATVDLDVIATSATDAGQSATDTTTTTVENVVFQKLVRNVTSPNGVSDVQVIGGNNYYPTSGGVSAVSGDVLEYLLQATAPATAPLTGAEIADSLPVFTTYVAGSTELNGNTVADVGGTSALFQSGGIDVNSVGEASGTVAAGESATVIFQVTVD